MLRAEMRALLLISTIAAASAQAVFTDTDTLRAAVRDPSCCDNGEFDEEGNTIRPRSYNNSCAYNGVHIKDWDVSQITDFNWMFHPANDTCLHHFNADISRWDVSSGLSFIKMFSFAIRFNQDISGWRPQNLPADKFDKMFYYAIKFDQKLDDWNLQPFPRTGSDVVDNVVDIWEMFTYTLSLSYLPTWWDTKWSEPVGSCVTGPNCGTCDQPKDPLLYTWLWGDNLPQTVTCNAGRLANYDGVSCRDQKCVNDNSLCCNSPCSAQTSASDCKEASEECWWNLDEKTCASTCSLDWKNEDLQQCSDTRPSCGEGTSNDNGVCKPACTSDGCTELVQAYKSQC